MLVNLLFSPNIIFVRLLQPENADSPIFLTPSGIVILAIPPHSANAPSPNGDSPENAVSVSYYVESALRRITDNSSGKVPL